MRRLEWWLNGDLRHCHDLESGRLADQDMSCKPFGGSLYISLHCPDLDIYIGESQYQFLALIATLSVFLQQFSLET